MSINEENFCKRTSRFVGGQRLKIFRECPAGIPQGNFSLIYLIEFEICGGNNNGNEEDRIHVQSLRQERNSLCVNG